MNRYVTSNEPLSEAEQQEIRLAISKCKKPNCHGRGYIAISVDGSTIPCSCAKKAYIEVVRKRIEKREQNPLG